MYEGKFIEKWKLNRGTGANLETELFDIKRKIRAYSKGVEPQSKIILCRTKCIILPFIFKWSGGLRIKILQIHLQKISFELDNTLFNMGQLITVLKALTSSL